LLIASSGGCSGLVVILRLRSRASRGCLRSIISFGAVSGWLNMCVRRSSSQEVSWYLSCLGEVYSHLTRWYLYFRLLS
jgi:hypothetical protein